MSATTQVAAGTWFHNPATGEVGRVNVGPAESHGRRFEADLWLQPGAAVVGAHIHSRFIERFEVLDGEVGLLLGDDKRHAGAGLRLLLEILVTDVISIRVNLAER